MPFAPSKAGVPARLRGAGLKGQQTDLPPVQAALHTSLTNSMVIIPLRNKDGELVAVTFVSDCDRKLAKLRWHLHAGKYARHTYSRDDHVYLHHLVMPVGEGFEVDHINGDKLDNRRSNLRRVTKPQQRQNLRSYRSRGSEGRISQYRGVSWDAARQKWRARVKKDGQLVFFGRFDNEVDAAAAAREHRLEVFSHTVDNKHG